MNEYSFVAGIINTEIFVKSQSLCMYSATVFELVCSSLEFCVAFSSNSSIAREFETRCDLSVIVYHGRSVM